MNIKMRLKGSFLLLLTACGLILTACSNDNDNEETLIMAQIGVEYQLDTWDVVVNSFELASQVALSEGSYASPQGGHTFLLIDIQATLTGDEASIFLPSRADESFGGRAEDGMTIIRGNLNDTLYFRVNSISSGGILRQGSGDWTIANTEVQPGETISGVVIFQFPSGDIADTISGFRITLF
ncbi:MAG: hypothetical protein FWC69_03805 [Defluviitaleaceae bacterium]|nr:hypothetical protein [Defluviitaleaceae bacterium]